MSKHFIQRSRHFGSEHQCDSGLCFLFRDGVSGNTLPSVQLRWRRHWPAAAIRALLMTTAEEATHAEDSSIDASVALCGADASVIFIGSHSVWKHYKASASYYRELQILQQLPARSGIVRLLSADSVAHVLQLEMHSCDLMRCILRNVNVNQKRIITTLVDGLHHCHLRGLVHRDLKLENILVSSGSTAVLCDFARSMWAPEPCLAPPGGTLVYMAPEACLGICAQQNDIWSLGIVLYCLVERSFPWDYEDSLKLQTPTFTCDMWSRTWKVQLRLLMNGLFTWDWQHRIGIKSVQMGLSFK